MNGFTRKSAQTVKVETYKRYGVALNHLKNFLRQKYHVKDYAISSSHSVLRFLF